MKLYASKTYIRLFYYVAPVGLVMSLAIPLYPGKELAQVLLSNILLYFVVGLGLYTTYRQSRLPVFEIEQGSLFVNRVGSGKTEFPLDAIMGIRRSLVSGHRLLPRSGEISIPLGWLTAKDRQIFLTTLNLKV